MSVITLPHNWHPYPWQADILDALERGKKRICVVAHRRAGKDALALNLAAMSAHRTVGSYFHVFPFAVQGRKALWRGSDDDGIRFIDQAFPPEIRKTTRDQEMSIEFLNGSLWQCMGGDNSNAIVGSNPAGVIFSEYALFPDDSAWNYTRPILARNDGWAIFISTLRGRNHMWELYQANRHNPDWYCVKLDVDSTRDWDGNRLLSDEDIEAERRAGMPEELIQQEFYNSPTASFSGAYYQRQMSQAQAGGRVGDFPWDPNLPVYAAFDIGYSDHTVAVFFQALEPNKTVIIGSKSWQFTSAADIALDIKTCFPWGNRISIAILPWDASKPGPGGDTWVTTFESFKIGLDEIVVLKKGQGTLHAEIAHVQQHLSSCWFDHSQREFSKGPNNGTLLEALTGYRTERIAKRPGVFSKSPHHTWESHWADAVRYALVYRYGDLMPGNWAQAPDFSAHDRAMGWSGNRPTLIASSTW
jgi:phage terminase large subunit